VPDVVTIVAAALSVCEFITNVGRSTGRDQDCPSRRTGYATTLRGVPRGRGGRLTAAVATAAVLAAALTACSTDAADQKVIDRLSRLDVMTVPAEASELSRTSSKGGGNSVIRNSSSVTLVYATTQTPIEVGQHFHAHFDPTWHFKDNGAVALGGWRASGGPGPDPDADPGTVADVVARPVTTTDKAPVGSRSLVTVEVSATRPA